MTSYRKLYLDIEVDSLPYVFPTPEEANRPIISIVVFDSYTRKYLVLFYSSDISEPRTTLIETDAGKVQTILINTEIGILKNFQKILNYLQPDVIVGWNLDFDFTYLQNRAKNLRFKDLDFSGTLKFDLLSAYKKLYSAPSYALKEIMINEGFIDKATYTGSNVHDLYSSKKYNEIIKYNIDDVRYLVLLEDKYKITDFFINMKETAGLENLENTLYNSLLIDTIALRIGKLNNIVLPSRHEGEEKKKYEGAMVMSPEGGIVSNVASLDMSKYYPSIILAANLSPECISDTGDIHIGDIRLDSKKEGITPKILYYLFDERKAIENEMKKYKPNTPKYVDLLQKRQVVKDLINSIYGMIGFRRSRIYNHDLASIVTKIGREGIQFIIDEARKKGFTPVYGDTDGIYVKVPYDNLEESILKTIELTEYLTERMKEYLHKKYNIMPEYLVLEFEKLFSKMFFIPKKKKRYAGRLVWEA